MYIYRVNEVYFIDRDNAVFKIDGLPFLSSYDGSRHLIDTLLDGEMIIDLVNGVSHPRFLIYDIISLEGDSMMLNNFSIRYNTIQVKLKLISDYVFRRQIKELGVRLCRRRSLILGFEL